MTKGNQTIDCDVAICGGGLSGLAASILLSRSGLSVVCIEPKPFPHSKVGESFDWSTPELLRSLGIDPEEIIKRGHGIPKKSIRIIASDGKTAIGGPNPWMAEKPWRLETVTLHADRVEFDKLLYNLAVKQGVKFVPQSIKKVEQDGEKITSFVTRQQLRIEAKWFVDASGSAQKLAKNLALKKRRYGRPKVSLWTTFQGTSEEHGTTLHGNVEDDYLSWIWGIPINEELVSVGCIITGTNDQNSGF